MPEICPSYVKYMLKICPKCVQDILPFQRWDLGWAGLDLVCSANPSSPDVEVGLGRTGQGWTGLGLWNSTTCVGILYFCIIALQIMLAEFFFLK